MAPSPDLDLHQVGYIHRWVTTNHPQANRECAGEPVTPQGSLQASDAVRDLGTSVAVPATPEVRRAHEARVTMYSRCAQAIDAALQEGRSTVAPEQQQEFQETERSTDWLNHPTF